MSDSTITAQHDSLMEILHERVRRAEDEVRIANRILDELRDLVAVAGSRKPRAARKPRMADPVEAPCAGAGETEAAADPRAEAA